MAINVRQHAKFRRNQLNPCWNIAIHLFKMVGVRHFRFVGQILGRPTTRIRWSLSLSYSL